jgi:RHS repeat-associated protein
MGGRRAAGRLGVRGIGMLAAISLLAAGLAAAPAHARAASSPAARPTVPLGPAARDVGVLKVRAPRAERFVSYSPAGTAWPAAGSAVASVAPRPSPMLTAVQSGLSALVSMSPAEQAGQLPLFAAPAGGAVHAVRFRMLPHSAAVAAGVRGVLFTAAAAAGRGARALVGVHYAGFGAAYGGGFGPSLGLALLPGCALTTPRVPACERLTRLKSANNASAQTVSATVAVPGAAAAPLVLAALSAPADGGGATGNYQATKLTPAGTWSAGGSGGDFSYSYPITAPPAPGGLGPDLTLGYDSGMVDAQTAQDQPQASWVGDGWSLPQASIAQSFAPCADSPEGSAAPASVQDACYDGPILDMTLGGVSTPLVCPQFSYSADSTCYAASDMGEVITHHVKSGKGQGTQFTDYWTVTTRDGTTYSFGLNRLPGWASGNATTNSVDWEPVFSAHSGDPCYQLHTPSFAGSACPMAYAWNLDYVTDSHGNAMAYFYTQASNGYDQYGATTAQSYIRDSYLHNILYGFTNGNAYSIAAATAPADEVTFTTGDRCFAGAASCDPLSTTTAAKWEDVPFNLDCTVGKACISAVGYGPTFWSTVALTAVATLQRTGTATTPSTAVDSWTLQQGFSTLPTKDTNDVPTLVLTSIARKGLDATAVATAGGSVSVPAETFSYQMLQNQLDPGSAPWMSRPRIQKITTETGSAILVNFYQPDPCPVSTSPVSPSANHLSCFPLYWGLFQPDNLNGDLGYPDWFIKYAVQSVQQTDPSGGSPGLFTAYHYAAPAWHYDDNEVVKQKERTYGQWRGYQKVYTLSGSGSDPATETETDYYQGMSNDNNTTDVTVADSQNNPHEDANLLAGDPLEQTAYDYAATWPAVPPQTAVDHSSIYSYWISGSVASRARAQLPDLTVNATGMTEQWNRQAITDTGTTTWRTTATDTTYFSATGNDPELGLPEYTYSLGDLSQLANPAQETCAATSYVEGVSGTGIVLPAETQVDALPCGGTSTGTSSVPSAGAVNALAAPTGVSSSNIVSDARTFYDDSALATQWPQPDSSTITWPQAAPGNTEVSVVQDAGSYSAGTFTYQTVSARTYDARGQVTASYDGNGGYNPSPAPGTYTPTSTSYTMTDGSVTAETVKNPLGQATTTSYDPARGLPVKTTDPNGITTTLQYDELGRLTSHWDNSRATSATANFTYSYVFGTATPTVTPTVVTQKQLNDEGGTITSTALYDSLLRPRQTQYPTPQGGILVTDDFYDSRGWQWKVNHNWWDSGVNPGNAILTENDSLVPNQTVTAFDALGRPVKVTSYDDSSPRSVAYTQYTGDKVIAVPAATGTSPITPVGATPTATVSDAIGRTTEQDAYTAWPAITTSTNPGGFPTVSVTGGSGQATGYGYDSRGFPSPITASGEQWSRTYDLLGQVTSATSPNSGTSYMSYDADGNLTQAKDANGNTITVTYDPLSRKTAEYNTIPTITPIATWAYDNSNNAVPSMTDPIGQLTTATSYDQNGDAFTAQQAGFNQFGESLGQTFSVPGDQGKLAGSYAFARTYSSTTGLPLSVSYPASPAFGGTTELPAETISPGYSTGFDLPSTISANAAGYRVGYVANVTYTAWTQVGQEELGTSAVNAFITNTWDPNTGQLTDSQVANTAVSATPYDDTGYIYDPSGNITSQTDTRSTPAGGSQTEQQCFAYTPLERLTQAWTVPTASTTACGSGPSTGTVGDGIAGAAYWTEWQYNPLGDQATETDHSLTGGSNTVTSYTYNNGNGAASGQPNTLTGSATTGGSTGSSAWTYDQDGNTNSQAVTASGTTQDECYAYTADSKLSQAWPTASLPCPATPPSGTTGYVYDASGSLLAADNPGSATLYLPGEQITATTDSSGNTTGITGLRFIPLPGGGQVVRTGVTTSFDYETADQHGTSMLVLDRTLQNPVWRQFTPYGAPRAAATGTWPDANGYLGDPVNATDNLTAIGARQYNPATGRFLTLDPVFQAGDPNQMGGYAYSGDNPVTFSDPTGLSQCDLDHCPTLRQTEQVAQRDQGPAGCPSSEPGCPGYTPPTTATTTATPISAAPCEVSSRFSGEACHDPMPVTAPGGPLSFLAGVGGFLVSTIGDPVACFLRGMLGCAQATLEGNTPSQRYKGWVASQGIDTADGSAYSSGEVAATVLLMAAGGFGEALSAAGAGTEEASALGDTSNLLPGYRTFSAAKKDLGSPGAGNVFDHTVEQSQIGRSGFMPDEIHSPYNLNPVPAGLNQLKANYYSTIRPFTGGGTVRDWLAGQSFADQYEFGMDILMMLRNGSPLP